MLNAHGAKCCMSVITTVRFSLPAGLEAPRAADVSVDYRSGCLYICCTQQKCILRARPPKSYAPADETNDTYRLELFAGTLGPECEQLVGGSSSASAQGAAASASNAQPAASDAAQECLHPSGSSSSVLKRKAPCGDDEVEACGGDDAEVHVQRFRFSYPHQVAHHGPSGMVLVLDGQIRSLLRVIHHGTVRSLPVPAGAAPLPGHPGRRSARGRDHEHAHALAGDSDARYGAGAYHHGASAACPAMSCHVCMPMQRLAAAAADDATTACKPLCRATNNACACTHARQLHIGRAAAGQ